MTATLPWKTAWITGASSGIGRELALQLARAGVNVAASARSADKLAELETEHPGIKSFPLDVTDASAVARTIEAITAQLGPIDLRVIIAGIRTESGSTTPL